MRQAHIGKHQIIDTVPKFERFVDLTEKRNDFRAILNITRFKMFFYRMYFVEVREMFSAKMDPVNAPGIFSSAAISMLYILGKNEKFIRCNIVLFVSDLIPPISVNTIKKE